MTLSADCVAIAEVEPHAETVSVPFNDTVGCSEVLIEAVALAETDVYDEVEPVAETDGDEAAVSDAAVDEVN